jgi:hypothetical protein
MQTRQTHSIILRKVLWVVLRYPFTQRDNQTPEGGLLEVCLGTPIPIYLDDEFQSHLRIARGGEPDCMLSTQNETLSEARSANYGILIL